MNNIRESYSQFSQYESEKALNDNFNYVQVREKADKLRIELLDTLSTLSKLFIEYDNCLADLQWSSNAVYFKEGFKHY